MNKTICAVDWVICLGWSLGNATLTALVGNADMCIRMVARDKPVAVIPWRPSKRTAALARRDEGGAAPDRPDFVHREGCRCGRINECVCGIACDCARWL